MRNHLQKAVWPAAKLGDAFEALAGFSGIDDRSGRTFWLCVLDGEAGTAIASAAEQIGCEVEPIECNWRELRGELAGVAPALIAVSEDSVLVTLRARRGKLQVLRPDRTKQWVHVEKICQAIQEPATMAAFEDLRQALLASGVSSKQAASAAQLLAREQLAGRRFDQAWILRSVGGRGFSLRSEHAVAFRNGAVLAIAHALQYLLWLLSWVILGSAALEGRIDMGWLIAWALAMLTILPIRFVESRAQAALAIGIAGLLKRRLFAGVLRLAPDEIKQGGVGTFLGQVFESENMEALAVNGAIGGLLAIMELAVAAAVLGRLSLLLLFWCGALSILERSYLRAFRKWTSDRMELSHALIESMVGHRTRLVQESQEAWQDEADRALGGYVRDSRAADRQSTFLAAGIPRAWLIAAIGCLSPAVISGAASATGMAASIGGILLAYGALRRLTVSLAGVTSAVISCERIAPLFRAASRPVRAGEALPARNRAAAASTPILEAHHLNYQYREGKAAVQNATFAIHADDRVLLEGPSGGGKSTLASLIAGMRDPQSGLLLSEGLDRDTLGDERWRKRIASAPQFHENHILSETLAFNLLMGRCWPPQPGDLDEAETLCRRLGLGGLLDRMPAGLMEMVGDCGWRLSHGEKGRIFMARALLQKAPLVVLDESFAALDPRSTNQALECALDCAETLMVIAHP